MEFIAAGGQPISGELLYDRRGLSFDFRPDDPAFARHARDAVELMYGSIALQIDRNSGELLSLWGYHPDVGWRAGTLVSPAATPTRMRVRLPEIPPRGVALRLVAADELTTVNDPHSGWIRIGRLDAVSGSLFAEFAAGCVAELAGKDLVALWLRPRPLG